VFQDRSIAFLGESGLGKSTLAVYLATDGKPDWRLLADDILPVTMGAEGTTAWPHFPQLKLPVESQPGPHWPEQLPLNEIYVLEQVDPNANPDVQRLSPAESVQMLLRHTAGTRMFPPELLERHLAAFALAAGQTSIYRLAYPHRKDTLPRVREILERSC
jgi:hypothetical protein